MLSFQQSGDGFPVILLHGYMESLKMWDQLVNSSNAFSWWAVDLPGHGETALLNEEMEPSIDWYAHEVISFIQLKEIKEFHLVGHSMGGYIALRIKEMIPDACKKVILLNSHPWEDSQLKKTDRLRVADIAYKAKSLFVQQAIPALFFQPDCFQEAIQLLTSEANNMSADAIAYAALAMRNRKDSTHVIDQFAEDFLIIQGKFDPLIDCEQVIEFSDVHKVKRAVLANSGHMAHIEEPDEISHLIHVFFRK